jgi:hypothetical protein
MTIDDKKITEIVIKIVIQVMCVMSSKEYPSPNESVIEFSDRLTITKSGDVARNLWPTMIGLLISFA